MFYQIVFNCKNNNNVNSVFPKSKVKSKENETLKQTLM